MTDPCLCGHDLSDHDAHDACGVWGCECLLFAADGWPPDADEHLAGCDGDHPEFRDC